MAYSFCALFCLSALADTGPCRLDAEHEIQICRSGDGAASSRVLSDKGKLAAKIVSISYRGMQKND